MILSFALVQLEVKGSNEEKDKALPCSSSELIIRYMHLIIRS